LKIFGPYYYALDSLSVKISTASETGTVLRNVLLDTQGDRLVVKDCARRVTTPATTAADSNSVLSYLSASMLDPNSLQGCDVHDGEAVNGQGTDEEDISAEDMTKGAEEKEESRRRRNTRVGSDYLNAELDACNLAQGNVFLSPGFQRAAGEEGGQEGEGVENASDEMVSLSLAPVVLFNGSSSSSS